MAISPILPSKLMSPDGPVVIRLFELSVASGGLVQRFAGNNEPITFHGEVYEPIDIRLTNLETGSVQDPVSIQAVVSNVTGRVWQLTELFWIGNIQPFWVVTVWYVDGEAPDETPLGTGKKFEVFTIDVDMNQANFELQPLNLARTRLTPFRSYSTTGGFPHIPQIN